MPIRRFLSCSARACTVAALLAAPSDGIAQTWPRTPLALAGGRVSVGGEVSATYGSDDPGFFNYTGYETSALRRVRAGVSLSLKASRQIVFLGEARVETGGGAEAYAYYVRVTPWPDRALSLQAGKIPPVFGTFARRGYPQDNPLIGDPALYQYLTSVRADALPGSAADVLRLRGRGWLVSYPLGDTTAQPGLPVLTGFEWDLGAQIHAGSRPLEANASWTRGSLSSTGRSDRPGHGTIAGRLALTPAAGLVFGVSAARGTFVTQAAMETLPPSSRTGGQQTALGLDGEYAGGYLILRGELVLNRWSVPAATGSSLPLDLMAGYLEGRYRLRPDLYLATRIERLAFDDIPGATTAVPWEARLTRLETGAGYSLARRARLKACYQLNVRDGGRVRRSHLVAVQLVGWF